jgi:hypothetical protein
MQILRPIFLRHAAGGRKEWKYGLRAGDWIIERMLMCTEAEGEGGKMQPTQRPLLIKPQIGDDQGILVAKMNVPRTKNALSRALVQQVIPLLT